MSDAKATNEIVVAVDGSDAGAAAVAWAANAAAKRSAPLKLVTAYTMPQFMYADGMIPPQELYDQLEEEAMAKINEARELVRSFDENIEVSYYIAESTPIDLLLQLSEEADIVVMGSRGLGGLSGLVLGSVSSAVVSHASSPVVVVRKDNDVTVNNKYGPVVVGVDGSDVSRKALEYAFREADARGATLRAVHSWADAQVQTSPSAWQRYRASSTRCPRRNGRSSRMKSLRCGRSTRMSRLRRWLIATARSRSSRTMLTTPSCWSSAPTVGAGSGACFSDPRHGLSCSMRRAR